MPYGYAPVANCGYSSPDFDKFNAVRGEGRHSYSLIHFLRHPFEKGRKWPLLGLLLAEDLTAGRKFWSPA